jgi:hypothetical protein
MVIRSVRKWTCVSFNEVDFAEDRILPLPQEYGGRSIFSHIMIGTDNLERSKAFCDPILAVLGVPPARLDGHRMFYRTPTGVFSVTKPINGEPSTCADGMTIGFVAASPALADAWRAAGPCCWRHHV